MPAEAALAKAFDQQRAMREAREALTEQRVRLAADNYLDKTVGSIKEAALGYGVPVQRVTNAVRAKEKLLGIKSRRGGGGR